MTQTPEAGKEITPLVIADLQKRSDAGLKTYGVRLQTHNGRNALQDAYEEALDLACYLKQALTEQESQKVHPDVARMFDDERQLRAMIPAWLYKACAGETWEKLKP